MMETEIKYIDNLCVKITDGSHFSPEDDEKGQYPMYSVKDMEYNSFSNQDCKHIGQEVFDKLSRQDCRPLKDDIVIAKDGSYLKYVFKVKEDLDACILSSIAILRPNKKVIDPDYFVYLMRSASVKNAMANYVSGSALPRIILSDFKKMKIAICSNLESQKQIASVLSAYDSQIENNQKRIKLLEQMAENLYKEWFVRFRFPGYETAEFEGGVPKGWKYELIKKLGQIVGGGTPSTSIPEYWDGDIPWLSPVDLSNNQRVYVKQGKSSITKLGMQKSSTKLLPVNTVLLSSRAPVGYVALAANPICTNQGFKSVICNENCVLPYYLFFFFKQNTEVLKSFASGATFPELSASTLGKIKVIVPPISIQKNFTSLLKPVITQMGFLYDQNDLLTTQRDLLLPRLMSGKLSI